MTPEEIKFLKLQNDINVKFEALMSHQESKFSEQKLNLLGISSAAISKRLTQLFVAEKYKLFNQLISEGKSFKDDLGFSQVGWFELIRQYTKFLGYLLKFHFLGSVHLFCKRVDYGNQVTVFDVHGFDQLFKEEIAKPVNFFANGPIPFFNQSSHILITSLKEQRSTRYSFVKNPWLELMKSNRLSIVQYFSYTLIFVNVFFHFTIALFKNPLLVKLYRDIGFFPLINFLNENKIVSHYSLTNTLADEQNLAISSLPKRNFITHFTSYSANSKPMKYKCHGDDQFAEYPYFRNIIVDQAWVWNQDQADWLKKFNPEIKTFVIGPVLFYLPQSSTTVSKNGKTILLFDVTPFPAVQIKERMGWHGYNYYQTENAVRTVKDILEVFEGYKIQIKPKRPYSNLHDQTYVDLINQSASSKKLDLLDTNVNTYQVISDADLVITTPYSSPALIAPALGKKAIYYDPTGLVLCNYQLPTNVYFCSGKEELKNLAGKLLDSF